VGGQDLVEEQHTGGKYMTNGTTRTLGQKITTKIVLALMLTAACAGTADARSMGAWGAGNPESGIGGKAPNWSCYAEYFGGVTGVSPFIQACVNSAWQVSLPVDSAGHTVSFSGAGDVGDLQYPCCTAYAVSPAGAFTSSNTQCANSASLVTRTLTNINVPSSGSLFLLCDGLGESASLLNTVNW
jgi:hypothetical protein